MENETDVDLLETIAAALAQVPPEVITRRANGTIASITRSGTSPRRKPRQPRRVEVVTVMTTWKARY